MIMIMIMMMAMPMTVFLIVLLTMMIQRRYDDPFLATLAANPGAPLHRWHGCVLLL